VNKMTLVLVIYIATTVVVGAANAEALSIYDIQYVDVNEHPDGNSPKEGQIVDCYGGIVVHKYPGWKPKIILYDPNNPDGWGGLVVKDFDNRRLYDYVSVGDWVSLTDTTVEEFNGNTQLKFESQSGRDKSSGNSLPEPLVVDVNDIAVVYDDVNEICYVTDHRAEKYEAMYIQVRNVTVGDYNDAGSHRDNYSLEDNNDPNIYCWASDYMNIDNPDDETPHPIVESGLELCSVSGILEQYTNLYDGWDYYQLLTTSTDSFTKTDLDGDCDFDFVDFSVFAQHWLTEEQCTAPSWCSGADRTEDGFVDIFDLMEFSKRWLDGK